MEAERQQSHRVARPGVGRRRGGFTLVEVVLVILIISVLVALVAGAVGGAIRHSRTAAERQLLHAMAMSIEQFQQEFGFLPPLVDDNANGPTPPLDGDNQPIIDDDLDNENNDERYSTLSFTYYVMGVLPAEFDGSATGFTAPDRYGKFSRRGKRYDPFFSSGADSERMVRGGPLPMAQDGQQQPRDPNLIVEIYDRWGTAIRLYRWEPTFYPSTDPNRPGMVERYNVPPAVGDPVEEPALRDARWALVSAGPDRLIDDGDIEARANRDNLVEVGR